MKYLILLTAFIISCHNHTDPQADSCPARISGIYVDAHYDASGNLLDIVASWQVISGQTYSFLVTCNSVSGGAPHETIGTNYSLGRLPPGDHTVSVQVKCSKGDGDKQSYTFTIP